MSKCLDYKAVCYALAPSALVDKMQNAIEYTLPEWRLLIQRQRGYRQNNNDSNGDDSQHPQDSQCQAGVHSA